MANTKTIDIEDRMNGFFTQNEKFFSDGDVNGKKAFYTLGMYYRRVMESIEKQIAEVGTETEEQTKFTKRINKEIGYNMTYRSFTTISKLLDNLNLTVSTN
jgi:hypothetical protein